MSDLVPMFTPSDYLPSAITCCMRCILLCCTKVLHDTPFRLSTSGSRKWLMVRFI